MWLDTWHIYMAAPTLCWKVINPDVKEFGVQSFENTEAGLYIYYSTIVSERKVYLSVNLNPIENPAL